jgi:N-acetyl sugar amidotransferase
MPDTKPDLVIDNEGICCACRAAEYKDRIDWNDRREQFERIVSEAVPKKGFKKAQYDCIIPVSGGKDSTYQVYMAKKVYKMNPLCVHFEPTYPSELGRRNLENIRKMGVDLISYKPNPDVYTKICKNAFITLGDHEWANHTGIFTVPIQLAVKLKIPLIIWGENPTFEYGGPDEVFNKSTMDEEWLNTFGGLLNVKVKQLLKQGFTKEELLPYMYPSAASIKKVGLKSLFLGYFFKWDAVRQVELIKNFGFECHKGPVEGTYKDYENLDDEVVSIHDYFKYLKFGFCRATDHASIDIRNKRISREEGLRLVKQYDGRLFPDRVDMFCGRFNMSREEFYKLVDKFANKDIFKRDVDGKLVWVNGNLINLKLKEELDRCFNK